MPSSRQETRGFEMTCIILNFHCFICCAFSLLLGWILLLVTWEDDLQILLWGDRNYSIILCMLFRKCNILEYYFYNHIYYTDRDRQTVHHKGHNEKQSYPETFYSPNHVHNDTASHAQARPNSPRNNYTNV